MMRTARFRVWGGLSSLVAGSVLLVVLGACAKNNESWDDGGPGGYTTLADGNRVPNSSLGNQNPDSNSGNGFVTITPPMPDAGSDATIIGQGPPMAIGTVSAQDCNGCSFPMTGGAAFAAPPAAPAPRCVTVGGRPGGRVTFGRREGP